MKIVGIVLTLIGLFYVGLWINLPLILHDITKQLTRIADNTERRMK